MAEPRGIDPKIATGLPPARDASDEDKGIYTVARFAAQNDHFVGHYKTWTKAINFLIGEHWRTKWDGTSLTWQAERDIPPWTQQPVTNLVYAVYRTAIAKLTKQKPTMEVVPPSGDSEDQEAAELCDALLVSLWRSLRKPSKMPIALGWMLITGMVFVRVGWDPLAGKVKPRTIPMQRKRQPLGGALGSSAIADAMGGSDASSATQPSADAQGDSHGDDLEDVNVAADERGEPYTKAAADGADEIDYDREPDVEPTGEICWDVVSPLCVRFNPEATSVDDAYEMYVATLWPRNKAAKHFGVKEEDLGGGSDASEQRALYEDLMSASAAGFPRSWGDQGSVWGVSQENAIGDRVLVIEYYHDKDDAFPEGRHWISAGATKVWPPTSKAQADAAEHETQPGQAGDTDAMDAVSSTNKDTAPDADEFPNGEAPLPFGFWPPLVPGFDTPIPGQPTALGVIPQVVPLNEQLNVLDGKIAEKHVIDAFGGIWFASPEDKGLVITSEPGQVIYSKAMGRRGAAFAPFQATMHPLAEPIYRERDVMTNKVMVVSGLSALDLSQKPQGVTSGRALLVTQETSDSVLMPTLFAVEAMLEECGRRELVIAQQKYREARTIAIKGDDGKYLYRSFTNADLRDGHDVRVQVGSSFPWSKSAQWDTKLSVIEAVPQLVLKPDNTVDKQALAKYLDSGTPGLGAFTSDEDPDLIEIQREHAMFEAFDPTSADGEHQLPQIAFWQNHAVHLEQHYDFMKKSYARYLRWSPAAQAAFKQHMQLTLVAIEQKVEGMMGPEQGEQGGQGGDGGDAAGGAVGAPVPSGGPPPAAGGAPGGAPPLVPGGGGGPKGPTQLNRGDFAAAQEISS
ncbi:MAG: 15, gp14 [Gemmatimonadetes bacterium]|nr:15, gp14 [Gemmatimonadota bacterium]